MMSEIVSPLSSLKQASGCLVESYRIKSDDKNFIDIRHGTYNKAVLYKDKLAPFSKVIVKNIGKDCDTIIFIDKKEEFKDMLEHLTIRVDLNKHLCVYTDKFHQQLLTEFKIIEGKIFKSIKELDLEAELKEKMNNFTTIVQFKEIFKTFFKGKNMTKQVIHYENTLNIFAPLLESVEGYKNFLVALSKEISVLRSELETLNERIDDEEPLVVIKRNAETVKAYCRKYHEMIPDIESDLKSITKENLGVLDNDQIDNWIPMMVDNIRKEEDLKEFTDLLRKMEEKKFSDFKLIKKIVDKK